MHFLDYIVQRSSLQRHMPYADRRDESYVLFLWHARKLRTQVISRYKRRSSLVATAILGCYLGGTRLSRSCDLSSGGQDQGLIPEWAQREVTEEAIAIVCIDAMLLPLQSAGRVVRLSVEVTSGVPENGQQCSLPRASRPLIRRIRGRTSSRISIVAAYQLRNS